MLLMLFSPCATCVIYRLQGILPLKMSFFVSSQNADFVKNPGFCQFFVIHDMQHFLLIFTLYVFMGL